jgi:hypothetical protein
MTTLQCARNRVNISQVRTVWRLRLVEDSYDCKRRRPAVASRPRSCCGLQFWSSRWLVSFGVLTVGNGCSDGFCVPCLVWAFSFDRALGVSGS